MAQRLLKTFTYSALSAMIVACAPAMAQDNPAPTAKNFIATQSCDDVIRMTDLVVSKYREQPLFQGMGLQFSAQNGKAYAGSTMMFVNQDSGTWSMISLYPDGTSCMVASGKEFKPYSGPKIGPRAELENEM